MKQYGALRAISGILKFIGWIVIGLGVLVFIFAVTGNMGGNSASLALGAAWIALVTALSVIVSGVLILAMGELIDAIVDIAQNTAHLPTLAQHSERTVGFFEHISAKANGPKPAAPAQQNR